MISNILERNLRKMSKFFKTFRPKSPETVDCGGRLWQMTSTFLSSKPRNLIRGIVTIGAYSVPLAVIISILFLDLAGSQPRAIAASKGTVVVLAPVSRTILSGIILWDLPINLTSIRMILESGLSGY